MGKCGHKHNSWHKINVLAAYQPKTVPGRLSRSTRLFPVGCNHRLTDRNGYANYGNTNRVNLKPDGRPPKLIRPG